MGIFGINSGFSGSEGFRKGLRMADDQVPCEEIRRTHWRKGEATVKAGSKE